MGRVKTHWRITANHSNQQNTQIMLKRIGNLIRGFFGLFVGGIEKRSPEALLDVEKENLRKEVANYNRGLAAHAGLCEELITRVTTLTGEEKDVRAKAAAHLRAGNRD